MRSIFRASALPFAVAVGFGVLAILLTLAIGGDPNQVQRPAFLMDAPTR